MKEALFSRIDELQENMSRMSDEIFDKPEVGFEEYFASEMLADYMRKNGFQVQMPLGSLKTAFRAEFDNGDGPSVGLLCEYDALPQMGHACGHHMQGPSICGAAVAMKETMEKEKISGKIIVYGTPAEEGGGGKIIMLSEGYMKDIDVALMMHGAPMTCVDVKSMAQISFDVHFFGKAVHAALQPENGRSALDALILAFNGVEFLREHVPDTCRMHYTVTELPGPANVVHESAKGKFCMRCYNSVYLHEQLIPRFKEVIRGASIMTGTTYEITPGLQFEAKIPDYALNDLMMENAKMLDMPNIQPPREKTGSSDFGNVMYEVPGCCIRSAFVPAWATNHSQTFLDYGKTPDAHKAAVNGAKVVAGTAYDLLTSPEIFKAVVEEFKNTKEKLAAEGAGTGH